MELGLVVLADKVVVRSRRVAENYGKEHKDVLRTIRTIIEQVPEARRNFTPSAYFNEQGRDFPEYIMDRQGFSMLVMGFTGEKARRFTFEYTLAFEQMAAELTRPKSSLDALRQTVGILAEQEQKILQLEASQKVIQSRLDTLDNVNIRGDKRQKLNVMVRKYAHQHGYTFSKAWKEFVQDFNTAYRVNLTARIQNHPRAKQLTIPGYLEEAGLLDDALRVADKMLQAKGA
jgi:Rha family phage regulatory protein